MQEQEPLEGIVTRQSPIREEVKAQKPLDEIVSGKEEVWQESEFYKRHPYMKKTAIGASYAMVGIGMAVMGTVLLPGMVLGYALYRSAKWYNNRQNPKKPYPTFEEATTPTGSGLAYQH